jgi:dTDP-4-amino-4,6-dideoxygalactose transaminase
LDQKGVGVGLNYEVPIHLQPIYKQLFGYKEGMLPVSEKLCKEVIAIPMFADITLEQQNYVVECVKGFYG